MMPDRSLRVLALLISYFTTGTAKNLIELFRNASNPHADLARAEVSVITFQCGDSKSPNQFITAAKGAGLLTYGIREQLAVALGTIRQLPVASERQPHLIQSHTVNSQFLVRYTTPSPHQYPWIVLFQHGHTWSDTTTPVHNEINRWLLKPTERLG